MQFRSRKSEPSRLRPSNAPSSNLRMRFDDRRRVDRDTEMSTKHCRSTVSMSHRSSRSVSTRSSCSDRHIEAKLERPSCDGSSRLSAKSNSTIVAEAGRSELVRRSTDASEVRFRRRQSKTVLHRSCSSSPPPSTGLHSHFRPHKADDVVAMSRQKMMLVAKKMVAVRRRRNSRRNIGIIDEFAKALDRKMFEIRRPKIIISSKL